MKLALALLAVVFSLSASASAEVNYFLSANAFRSCAPATALAPASYLQINSFGFGGTEAVTAGARPSLQNLVIAKAFDACSGILMSDFLMTVHIQTLTLTAMVTTVSTTTPLTITLSDAAITNYTLNSSAAVASEQVSFTFSKACIATATTSVCYDSSGNTVS